MHTRDVLKLGLKNIRTHLGRSLILMVVSGVIFMLIFVVNLWLQGLENTYQKYAGQATDGRVIVVASTAMNSISATGEATQPAIIQAEMIADLERFGAKVVGERELYGVYGSVILDANLMSGAVEVSSDDIPEGAVSMLVPSYLGQQLLDARYAEMASSVQVKADSYRKYRSKMIGKTLASGDSGWHYIVGLTPSGFGIYDLSFKGINRKSTSPLNAILEMIPTPSATPIVLASPGSLAAIDINALGGGQSVIAVFPDSSSAYRYFKSGQGQFMDIAQRGRTYSVNVLAGMSPETQYIFQMIKIVANIGCVILATVALVVIVFTSIRLVDQEQRNIRLYYSLGATRRQVQAIYLCYFFELAFGALILAVFVAVGVAIGYSILNHETLGVLFMVAFSLPEQPEIMLCGMNLAICGFAVLLLLSPVLSVAVNGRRLKAAS